MVSVMSRAAFEAELDRIEDLHDRMAQLVHTGLTRVVRNSYDANPRPFQIRVFGSRCYQVCGPASDFDFVLEIESDQEQSDIEAFVIMNLHWHSVDPRSVVSDVKDLRAGKSTVEFKFSNIKVDFTIAPAPSGINSRCF